MSAARGDILSTKYEITEVSPKYYEESLVKVITPIVYVENLPGHGCATCNETGTAEKTAE